MDVIRELLATNEAVGKLGARTISIDEARQLLNNRYERTREPSTWLIITGWEATARERKLLEG